MRRHKILTSLVCQAAALALACGGDDGTTPPPPDPPVVETVSATTVSPGDTLVITGSNFSDVATENTVTFRNPVSGIHPFQASATELHVVVDRDATDGPVSVTTAGGTDSGGDLTVTRGIGDVFVFGGKNSNELTLPNPTPTTRYLVVPHGTSSGVAPLTDSPYTIETASAPPAAPSVVTAPDSRATQPGPHEWFEARRWENAAALIERYGRPRGEFGGPPGLGAQAPPDTIRRFYVLKKSTGDQDLASSYQRITARLRYDGTKCLVYADLDTLPTGNFTQTHFNSFGQAFDNSIEATNVGYFGNYSDVDGNGRVILLVTPVVNRLEETGPTCSPGTCAPSCGFIAGFFNPRDLFAAGQVPSGTTNHTEIMYLLAPDPTGFWDCQFSVSFAAAENLGTITHEHEHLISFSHRLFNENRKAQVTWLEEGMAHMAEDLNGDNSSNVGRGKTYRADPGGFSLEDNKAPLGQRGGIYLMLRLLTDRYGTDILKDIVQSECTGRACIQSVTGMSYVDVLAEFFAAQYLSGRGITDDERFNYATLNLTDPLGPEYFGNLTVFVHAAGGPDVADFVKRSGADFHDFSGTVGMNSVFRFTDPNNAGLRNVIVRVQ